MKKRCTLIPIVLLLLIITVSVKGQLSVTATAGTTGPTVYTNLGAAFAAVNAGTHQGNITISVTNNTTEAATANLNASGSGSASYTSVLIKPAAGVTATISGSINSGPVVKLSGSNRVTIDGSNNGSTSRNLSFANTSASSSNVLMIGSVGTTPITNVTVKNAIIINGANTSTAVLVGDAAVAGSPGYFNNITLQNNAVQKAYIGIYLYAVVTAGNGNATLVDKNNLDAGGANAIRLVGVYCQGLTGATISNNQIGNFESASAEFDRAIWLATATTNTSITGNTISGLNYSGTSSYAPIGINVSPGVTNSNVTVTGNTITNLTSSGTGTTMGLFSYSAASGVTITGNKIGNIKNTNTTGYGAAGIIMANTINTTDTKLRNNFVWDVASYGYNGYASTDNGNGIVIDGGGGYDIDFNTVALTTDQTLTGSHRASALLITANVTASGAINLRNNLLVNQQTVGNANSRLVLSNLATSGNAVFASIDYNDYYSASGNLSSTGTNASITTTLAQLQASLGGNANSKNVQPSFIAANDLHLRSSFNTLLENGGTPLAGITTDIDNETRDAGAPDIGADEINCITITATENISICASALPYTWNGKVVIAAGNAAAKDTTISALSGCDSITTLNLVVNPLKTAIDNVTICAGQLPYTWNGQAIAAGGAGVATFTTPSALTGCDSTVTLNLTVNPLKTATDDVTVCINALPYTWNGQTITAGGAGVATFTTPSALTGCDSTVTLNLTVNPLKTATDDITICSGQLPYTWNGQTITAGGAAVATYTTPSAITGCDSTVTLNLTVNEPPVIDQQPVAATVSALDNVFFEVTVTGTGPFTYQWEVNTGSGFTPLSNGGVYNNVGTATLNITGAAYSMNGYQYRCIVTGSCTPAATSNSALLTVNKIVQTITIQTPSTINATYGDLGVGITATTGSGLSLVYATSDPGVATINASGQITITGTGTVVITISQPGDNNYLPAADVYVTIVIAKKDLIVKADDKSRPYGEADPALTISYSGFVNGENQSVITSPTVATYVTLASEPGTFPIILTGGSAANYNIVLSNGTFTITGAVIQVVLQPGNKEACYGITESFSTQATATSLIVTPAYQWQQSTNNSNWQNIAGATAATYTAQGNTTVYIRCVVTAPGTTRYTNAALFTVHELPVIQVEQSTFMDCSLSSTQLNATGAVSYQWSPATGLSNTGIANPVANPASATWYTVTGTDSYGCSATQSIEVGVRHNNYPMANAFTPNGDGKNDCFGIKSWGVTIQKIEFSIYNRYGARVFYTNDPSGCWDGRYQGQLQGTGTFVYMIKAVTACGVIDQKGTLLLVR
ncbi:MAG: gliding motility-associated C-terminal domain-containing protein [Chitinophagaceae bacterium]